MNGFLVFIHRLLKTNFLVPSDAVAVKAIKFTTFDPIAIASERQVKHLSSSDG